MRGIRSVKENMHSILSPTLKNPHDHRLALHYYGIFSSSPSICKARRKVMSGAAGEYQGYAGPRQGHFLEMAFPCDPQQFVGISDAAIDTQRHCRTDSGVRPGLQI